ncbi:protein GIGAS CELL1-like [Panicum miliaceum]|uniref:Protein GIGAS CELL1-like n=1 Tax=Panicum miliaceum TaxID=4540 RepID=A0A3L6RS82_PANMI|nr:protein GIGAS CELL1-like [Panicum miliaceum]
MWLSVHNALRTPGISLSASPFQTEQVKRSRSRQSSPHTARGSPWPAVTSIQAAGANPRKSTQESHANQGCIAGSSRRGDRIGVGWRGAEQIVRYFLLFPGGCALAFCFFERLGDAGFLLVLLLQICRRVSGLEADQERRAPVLGCFGLNPRNYKMPQVRTASRPVLAGHSGGGFFIRRVASPGIVVAKCTIKPLARRARTPLSNKENVPPAGAVKAAPKRSPLPDWYPRTPLRDITSIVKTLERRNRLQDAVARQQIQWIEDSSQLVDPTTPVQAEQYDPQSTLQAQETQGAAVPDPGLTSVVANLTTFVTEGKPMASSSPSDCSLRTVSSKPNDSALADLMEKKLSRSIEKIEKMVSQRLKETLESAQPSKVAVQRRTLMSMR